MPWTRLLAYVTGTVNQELLLRNEYLVAENRILRGQISGRLGGDRSPPGSHGSGRGGGNGQARYDSGLVSKVYRKKFDGSKSRRSVGRPKIDQETEGLVLQMARKIPVEATIGS
jgi:hypothetical protein